MPHKVAVALRQAYTCDLVEHLAYVFLSLPSPLPSFHTTHVAASTNVFFLYIRRSAPIISSSPLTIAVLVSSDPPAFHIVLSTPAGIGCSCFT